ncbi:MAG: hypothetical protein KJO07_04990, partial [Deltaproteobacteria bacterium]|nr:hypothetical protein [Deltaproteobacteria bacterium]
MEAEPRQRFAALVPLVAVVLAHGLAVFGGFTNWDDALYLVNNPLTVDPLAGGWWNLLTTPEIDYAIPVTVVGYAAQRALFGLNPMYFHLVSLLLHLGVVALSYSLARSLGIRRWAAAGAASLLAVHPLTVE